MQEPEDWRCPICRAMVDGPLQSCWQCGTSREGQPDPDFKTAVEVGPRTHCPQCQYPYEGLSSDRCPECGEPIDRNTVDTPTAGAPPADPVAESRRRVWLVVLIVTILGLYGLVTLSQAPSIVGTPLENSILAAAMGDMILGGLAFFALLGSMLPRGK